MRSLKIEEQFGNAKVFETLPSDPRPVSIATFDSVEDARLFVAIANPDIERAALMICARMFGGRQMGIGITDEGVQGQRKFKTQVWEQALAFAQAAFYSLDTTDGLTAEYGRWCQAEGVEFIDAQEHIAGGEVTPEQLQWLMAFEMRWNDAQEREDAERRDAAKEGA